MGNILSKNHTNRYFENMMKADEKKLLKGVHFTSVSQVWIDRQFYIVEDSHLTPRIAAIVTVTDFWMDLDHSIKVRINIEPELKKMTVGYVPQPLYKNILVSIPSSCIIAMQIYDNQNGSYTPRPTAGLMFKQPSDPRRHNGFPALVEDSRMDDTYGKRSAQQMIADFIEELT